MDGPITIDDARSHMRVTTRDEDENIGRLIRVAARQIETVYGIVSVEREQSFSFDRFMPEMRIPLIPVAPDSISILYLDSSGQQQSLTDFRAFERHDWTWIAPSIGGRWPCAANAPAAISVTATVGYVDPQAEPESQKDAAPQDLQQAARLLVEHLFLRSGGSMPAGVDDLVDHYRFRRL